MVRVVLTAAPIYLLIAMDLPKWCLKAIDKKKAGVPLEGASTGEQRQLLGCLGKGTTSS
jgi:hypothetical protein